MLLPPLITSGHFLPKLLFIDKEKTSFHLTFGWVLKGSRPTTSLEGSKLKNIGSSGREQPAVILGKYQCSHNKNNNNNNDNNK